MKERPVIVLIAYYFPPDPEIGGARPFRFYKYLKKIGYECRVLTAAVGQGPAGGDAIAAADPLRLKPRQGWLWQADRVAWKFLLRGMTVFGWSNAAYRAGRELLRQAGKNTVLVSTSPPVGTHLTAWRLAREFGCRWIADFRDPIDSVMGGKAALEPYIAPMVEKAILRKADWVLANTDSMRDRWEEKLPGIEKKVTVIWNGFDPEDAIVPEVLPERSARIWSHVGELYGGRSIVPILEGVNRLIEEGKLSADGIQIRQIGVTEEGCVPGREFQDTARWLELMEPVAPAEARRLALESDALLLIQPQSAIQVPGKLFEYLRMGRPILAYVVQGSPVERILEQAGIPYECIYPGQSEGEISFRIKRFWDKGSFAPAHPSAWFEETFEASRQAGTLDSIIRNLEFPPI